MKLFKTVNAQIVPEDINQKTIYVLDSTNPEVILVKAIRKFMEGIGFSSIYPNFDNIRISTVHPFAMLLAQDVLDTPKLSNMFPSITVGDSSTDEDAELVGDGIVALVFKPEDIASLEGRIFQKELFVSDSGLAKIKSTVDSKGYIVGIKKNYHTTHTIDLNIWTENKEVTSFIFDMLSHFVTQERTAIGDLGITLGAISGRRSGDINLDFGMLLYGGNLRVTASMNHESVAFDTGAETISDVDTMTLPSYFVLGGN